MAIGNYIHLYPSYYLRYGVNPPEYKEHKFRPEWGYISAKHKYLSYNPPKLFKPKEIEQIENLITSIWNPNSENKVASKIREKLEDVLDKEFGKLAGDITNTGSVVWNAEQLKAIAQANIQKIATINTKTKTGQNEIGSVVTKLQNAISQINRMAKAGLLKDVTEAQALAKSLETQLDALIKQQNWGDIKTAQNMKSLYKFDRDFLEQTNNLIKEASLSKALSIQKGFMFEYAVAAAIAAIRHETETIIDDEFAKMIEESMKNNVRDVTFFGAFVTGDTKNIRTYNKEKFDPAIWNQMIGLNNGKFGQELTSTIKVSQNKVDILLNFEEGHDALSAKNYNLKGAIFTGGVKLVSATPLLRLLEDEDDRLVNHYLNIIGQTGRNQEILKAAKRNFITEIRSEIRTIIAFKALSGDQSNIYNQANWFILNNNQTGQVKLIHVSDLLNKIMRGNNPTDRINITANRRALDQLTLKQEREPGPPSNVAAQQRIAKFLQDVHKQKITATIPVETFKALGYKV